MLTLLFVTFTLSTLLAQYRREAEIKTFPLENVTLLEGPFPHAQNINKQYLLALDIDRLLAPFQREAGLHPKSPTYSNWENTGLDGHIGGHYLTALSLMYATTQDPEIEKRLDKMLSELQRCQLHLGTGYIGGVPNGQELWQEIADGKIQAGHFDLNSRWVPLYNIHKTYAGLRDAYLIAGRQDAKEMLIRMTDWMIKTVENLSEEQIQQMLHSEHGGLNEVFADVASITDDPKYLTLAKRFTHTNFLEPLLHQNDVLTGVHANTQIPKIIGVKSIADVENNADWNAAAAFFWDNVVNHRSVTIGGNSTYEHFHATDDFSSMIHSVEGPETCNTYNMLKLSKQLFLTEGLSKYVDYYERALYNHILSSQHPEHGGFVYFTPMRPGHYRVYSQPHTSFWCCVGSGIESQSKYGEFIYAHRDNELFVNLFIPSKLNWQEKNVTLLQETSFPQVPQTTLTVKSAQPLNLALKMRYPTWIDPGSMKVMVNGKSTSAIADQNGYVEIERRWEDGDNVVLEFEMMVKAEQLPDESAYYAFSYGPVVLAAKTSNENLDGLLADDSRGGHIAKGPQVPLRHTPVLIGDASDLPQHLSRISAKDLRFQLTNTYQEDTLEDITLQPFYQIHDTRYVIYWPQASSMTLAKERMQFEENTARIRLDSLTIDQVHAGQQQPESDHNIQFENTNSAAINGVQYRQASGWFSYTLNNPHELAQYLLITHFEEVEPTEFDISINDIYVKTISAAGQQNLTINEHMIEIPNEIKKNNQLIVKFIAKNGRNTSKIITVKLLSDTFEETAKTTF